MTVISFDKKYFYYSFCIDTIQILELKKITDHPYKKEKSNKFAQVSMHELLSDP